MAASTRSNQADAGEVKSHSNVFGSIDFEPSGIKVSKERIESSMIREDISRPLEQWNKPRINLYRYFASLYSFIIMGMNDAAYGVSQTPIS